MHMIQTIAESINTVLWDYLLLFLLVGTGLYFTIRLRFIQIRKFGEGMRRVFGGLRKKDGSASDGELSSFQALTTAIAAQVGTGNIAGAATAIAAGGPGAIFWMWVSAFLGMATIYAEAVLAQKHRQIADDGTVTGGPIYYIRAAFTGKFGKILAGFFAISITIALGFAGNMVQSNSIGSSFENAFGIPPVYTGIFVTIVAAFIFIGGIKRLASITEKLVPFMAIFYVLGCLIILGINYANIIPAFRTIFVAAFQPQAITGAIIGVTVREAMRYGVARGLFSNEAGMGSTPHAHALAKVKQPHDQGVVAMTGVFIDTFVVLTMTALVIVSTGMWNSGLTGSHLAQTAFNSVFGSFGNIFIAICMLFFAFSTILSWFYFGKVNANYLFGKKFTIVYTIIALAFIFVGSLLKVDLVWELNDLFNGIMVLPNLIAIIALGGSVVKLSKNSDK